MKNKKKKNNNMSPENKKKLEELKDAKKPGSFDNEEKKEEHKEEKHEEVKEEVKEEPKEEKKEEPREEVKEEPKAEETPKEEGSKKKKKKDKKKEQQPQEEKHEEVKEEQPEEPKEEEKPEEKEEPKEEVKEEEKQEEEPKEEEKPEEKPVETPQVPVAPKTVVITTAPRTVNVATTTQPSAAPSGQPNAFNSTSNGVTTRMGSNVYGAQTLEQKLAQQEREYYKNKKKTGLRDVGMYLAMALVIVLCAIILAALLGLTPDKWFKKPTTTTTTRPYTYVITTSTTPGVITVSKSTASPRATHTKFVDRGQTSSQYQRTTSKNKTVAYTTNKCPGNKVPQGEYCRCPEGTHDAGNDNCVANEPSE